MRPVTVNLTQVSKVLILCLYFCIYIFPGCIYWRVVSVVDCQSFSH